VVSDTGERYQDAGYRNGQQNHGRGIGHAGGLTTRPLIILGGIRGNPLDIAKIGRPIPEY
jgi:hypothetical protein